MRTHHGAAPFALPAALQRDFQGQWRVLPATLERGPVGGGCVVEHRLSVKPLMDVPAPIAKLTSGIFMRQVSLGACMDGVVWEWRWGVDDGTGEGGTGVTQGGESGRLPSGIGSRVLTIGSAAME